MKVKIPSRGEQDKIIGVIKSLEIDLSKSINKKELFVNVKKGLMQQLLTGKKRVKID